MSFNILDDSLTESEGVERLSGQLTKQRRRLIFWAVFFTLVAATQIGCLAYHFYLDSIDEPKSWPEGVAVWLFLLSIPLLFILYFSAFFTKKIVLEINFLIDTQRSEDNQRFSNRLFLAVSIFAMLTAMLVSESDTLSLAFHVVFMLLLLLAINLFFYTLVEKCLKYHFFTLLSQRGDQISEYHRNPLLISLIGLLFFWFLISMGAVNAIKPTTIAPFVMGKTATVGATVLAIGLYFALEFIGLLLLRYFSPKNGTIQ